VKSRARPWASMIAMSLVPLVDDAALEQAGGIHAIIK